MKTLFASAISLTLATTTPTSAQSQSFVIDANANQLTWTGYAEVGSWAPSGTVRLLKGQLTQTGNRVSKATMVLDMTTIQHENDQLQTHLRDEAFFDVARFPTATFALGSITNATASGQLTVRGVTKPIMFPVVISQEGSALRIKGRAVIDRTQFGIRYNSTGFFADLGDQAIKNEFALTFDVVAKPIETGKRGATQ